MWASKWACRVIFQPTTVSVEKLASKQSFLPNYQPNFYLRNDFPSQHHAAWGTGILHIGSTEHSCPFISSLQSNKRLKKAEKLFLHENRSTRRIPLAVAVRKEKNSLRSKNQSDCRICWLPPRSRADIWVIDQAWGQDGWILVNVCFCVFMDRDGVEVHKNSIPYILHTIYYRLCFI